MATTAWVNFGAFSDVAVTSGIPWSNETFAQVEDGSVAATTYSPGDNVSNWLQATGPSGLSIPSDATIRGVEIDIKRQAGYSGSPGTTTDYSIRLIKGGTVFGDDKASPDSWPYTLAYASYGGEYDLWGLSLAPSDLGSGFGVNIQCRTISAASSNQNAQIDHVRVRVHYDDAAMFLVI